MPRSQAPIRVMIVDDSAAARAGLTRLLSADPGIAVTATACDPFDAAEQMRSALPDVLILDLALPRMDGLTFLRRIMAQRPMPVIVCSSFTARGSENAMKALESGAAEVVAKPRLGSPAEVAEAEVTLCDAVRAAASTHPQRKADVAPKALRPGPKLTADAILPELPPRPGAGPPNGQVIAIGASTGGTEALVRLLSALPAGLPPILIVQHMPEHFTRTFAQRLDRLCKPAVTEAASGDRPIRGTVHLAPGGKHMMLRRNGAGYIVDIVDGQPVARHRPSVDVLFRSVAQAAGRQALGLVLTGMGDDGARGLLEMRNAGAATAVQDEASSVVFGMPREALAMGGATTAYPLTRLPDLVLQWSAEIQTRAGA
ncbi:two-component system, chemotaxis family, response regulator CheB [Wenxinia saemankumensis]|uniref:Protein-glutamate methylesterase/protein-glutamine glutaminase n=2 Tax=Wenxinia saemankumensis TaxID=1447782 RepID=A0A1M6DWP5_9RHOB|nr:chemotaxis response regulator protein-glutamate methylesterase [Wenxinia saemankumensis]SHI77641.1 two-component system, chemotaxis family, response regulator CheB [Wenxinia saemankumensis]